MQTSGAKDLYIKTEHKPSTLSLHWAVYPAETRISQDHVNLIPTPLSLQKSKQGYLRITSGPPLKCKIGVFPRSTFSKNLTHLN